MNKEDKLHLKCAVFSGLLSLAVTVAPGLLSNLLPDWASLTTYAALGIATIHVVAGGVAGWRWPKLLAPVAVGPAAIWCFIFGGSVLLSSPDGQMGFVLIPAAVLCFSVLAGGILGWLLHQLWLGGGRLTRQCSGRAASRPAADRQPR